MNDITSSRPAESAEMSVANEASLVVHLGADGKLTPQSTAMLRAVANVPSNLRESAVSGDLYMALAMAQAQFTNPARNKTAIVRSKKGDNSSYQFKYASFDQIVEMARPALAGAGLALIQPITTVDKQPALVTKIAHGKSGQWLETVLPLPSVGGDPQAFSSVITYLKRYAFCSLLGIAADQDDDGNKASKRAQAATIIDNGPAPRGDRGTPAESESPQPVRPAIDDSFAETVTLQLAKLASRATDIDDVGAALAYWNTHSDVLMRARAKHHPQLADYLLAVLHPILKQHLGDILSSAFCLAVEAETVPQVNTLEAKMGAKWKPVFDGFRTQHPEHSRKLTTAITAEFGRVEKLAGLQAAEPAPSKPQAVGAGAAHVRDGGHEEVPAANGDHWLVGADGELTGEQFSSLIAFAAAFAREWTHADPDARLALEEHNADALDAARALPDALRLLPPGCAGPAEAVGSLDRLYVPPPRTHEGNIMIAGYLAAVSESLSQIGPRDIVAWQQANAPTYTDASQLPLSSMRKVLERLNRRRTDLKLPAVNHD